MTFKQVARFSLALVGLVTLWACNDRKIQVPSPAPGGQSQNFFEQNVNNDIDILFLIDNSGSMGDVQTNLVQNFPVFIDVLKNLPSGLPNVHIGITTSSMGAGAFTSTVQSCQTPDLGNFVDTPRIRGGTTACQQNQLNSGAHFIEALNNEAQKNYTGDLSTVFSCLAEVGDQGCGFEHHLAGVRAALGDPMGSVQPAPNNGGFLRENAFLAVIIIGNEDDCSAPPDTLLFDPSQT